jgi:predicted component of type VI protein secretion system
MDAETLAFFGLYGEGPLPKHVKMYVLTTSHEWKRRSQRLDLTIRLENVS